MATWILGDIHGCARELAELLERLALGPEDTLVSAGDLFHRGPDPAGVMDVLEGAGARFILGNHERAVLRRMALDPKSSAPGDRPPKRDLFPRLDSEDLRGDGGMPCETEPERRVEIVRFLQEHSGYALHSDALPGEAPDPFVVVHAGLLPGCPLENHPVEALTSLRRLKARGKPWWYEAYEGPELVLFGHTPSPVPRVHQRGGKPLAIGLDTGCVYGGRLTAYSPEKDAFVSVCAQRAYASARPTRRSA